MPTEAFYKLDPAKKEQILSAAIQEFSQLPYEKVSIFKIAQSADVSRSGFYYYFKDKRDIYGHLINDIKDEFINTYDINNKSFDIFWLCECIFEFIVSIKGTNREGLFRRIVLNVSADDLKLLFNFIENPQPCCHANCSMEGIELKSPEQLKGIVMFLATSIMFAVGGYMDDDYDLQQAKERLYQMMDVIKYGIVKGV